MFINVPLIDFNMPNFLFAKTMKYLYLAFSINDARRYKSRLPGRKQDP
jgi:hypothetical protein